MLASDGLNRLRQWSYAALLGPRPTFFVWYDSGDRQWIKSHRENIFRAGHLQLTSADDTIFTLFSDANIPTERKSNLSWNIMLSIICCWDGHKMLLASECPDGRDMKEQWCDFIPFCLCWYLHSVIYNSLQKSRCSVVQASILINQ